MSKILVILDCNVYIRAFVSSSSPSYRIIELAGSRKIDLVVSRYTINEFKDVVSRPEFAVKFRRFDPANWKAFMKQVREYSRFIRSVPAFFELKRDKKDSHYLELAVLVEADVLVTNDRDLLDLMTGIDLESKQFRQRCRNLTIMRPDEFLQKVSDSNLGIESNIGP